MNDNYGWKTGVTIAVILLFVLMMIGDPKGWFAIGLLCIGIMWASHIADKEEHERLKKEKEEKEKRIAEIDEKQKEFEAQRDKVRAEIAEIKRRHAEIMREVYELQYGKDDLEDLDNK